jgi:hypothetical protein
MLVGGHARDHGTSLIVVLRAIYQRSLRLTVAPSQRRSTKQRRSLVGGPLDHFFRRRVTFLQLAERAVYPSAIAAVSAAKGCSVPLDGVMPASRNQARRHKVPLSGASSTPLCRLVFSPGFTMPVHELPPEVRLRKPPVPHLKRISGSRYPGGKSFRYSNLNIL